MPATVHRESTDDLEALLATLPPEIGERMRGLSQVGSVIEVVMDLGRKPEARLALSLRMTIKLGEGQG